VTNRRPSDDCSSFERWLTPFVDGELDAVHTIEVEEHLDRCECCCERATFMRAMRGSLREEAPCRAPSSLRDRLLASMAAERAADDEVEPAPPQAVEAEEEDRDSKTSDAPHAVPASKRSPKLVRLRYVFPLAAAAALVLVLGVVKNQAESSADPTARRISPGLSVSPLATADGFNSPVLASLEPLDQLVEDLVAQHAEPLPPETTDPQSLQKFDRYVGVKVPRPKFDSFDARYLGARVHPVSRGKDKARTAVLQYMLRNRHRVTVYVFDSQRVPMRAKHLEHRKVGRQKIYVGKLRGYSVAASESKGIGYALASDLSGDESAKLVATAAR
jgi:anti-sigma factor RsiW